MLTAPDTPPTQAAVHGTPRSQTVPRLAIVVFAASLVIAFYTLGWYRYLTWETIQANLHEWKALAQERMPLSLMVFFLAYVITTSLSLPVAFFLSLLAGALFDWWMGVAVASLATTIGAVVAFLSSRYVLRDWVRRRFGPRLEPIDRGFREDGAWYLFSLRLTPLVPFFLVNLGMGLTPMRLSTFALVSWLGMLPVKCVLVYAGLELGSITDPRDILSPHVMASLVLLGVTPLALRLVLRAMRRETPV